MSVVGPMPEIVHGDARALDLPDESVDLIACSPPYWSLRSYTDGGEHYDGQLGSEPTWQEYVDSLIGCTREWMRVLKPTGSLFVNLGDKYGPDKSLMDLPWRYGIRCVDELGLIKRAEIIWSKVNGLPESVADRVRRSHEVVLHLTKAPRYFAAVDEIREPTQDRGPALSWQGRKDRGDPMRYGEQRMSTDGAGVGCNPLGKLPGSVWEIATQPLKVPAELGVDHFAAWPMEIPRRLILGWSPREVCTACGEGRRPVAEQTSAEYAALRAEIRVDALAQRGDALAVDGVESRGRRSGRTNRNSKAGSLLSNGVVTADRRITGYACACPDTAPPSTPGVVLDPFSGTGTTALVATMLGRRGIGVDLSEDYCRLAWWRCSDPKERARAAGLDPAAVSAIKPEIPGQSDLFDLLDGEAS